MMRLVTMMGLVTLMLFMLVVSDGFVAAAPAGGLFGGAATPATPAAGILVQWFSGLWFRNLGNDVIPHKLD